MKRAELDSKTIPCLLCERDVQMGTGHPDASLADIEKASFDLGVECRTYGNYGSQVWDMDGILFFVLCDECVIRHSHKMIVKERDHSQTKEEFAAILEGKTPEPKYKPVRNARDHYDEWFAWLNEKYQDGDSYYDSVSPYFKAKKKEVE